MHPRLDDELTQPASKREHQRGQGQHSAAADRFPLVLPALLTHSSPWRFCSFFLPPEWVRGGWSRHFNFPIRRGKPQPRVLAIALPSIGHQRAGRVPLAVGLQAITGISVIGAGAGGTQGTWISDLGV